MEENDIYLNKISIMIILLVNISNTLKNIEKAMQTIYPQLQFDDKETQHTPIFFSEEEYYNYGD